MATAKSASPNKAGGQTSSHLAGSTGLTLQMQGGGGGSTLNVASHLQGNGNFEQVIGEQEKHLALYAQQFGSEMVMQVRDSISYQIEEIGLECP